MNGSINIGITYTKTKEDLVLNVYCNTNYAEDTKDRKCKKWSNNGII